MMRKNFFYGIAVAMVWVAAVLAQPVCGQTKAVIKTISTNGLTGDLVVPTGVTLTVESGGALTIASGGTFNLSGVYQPLDADLTAIAATITTSHGRSLLTGTSASDTRSTLGLVIGTDVLAPNGSGASLTALNGSNISSGTVAPARLGSGSSITTKFLRGDSTWQTVSGGGVASMGDEVAYVFPETGNDTTGDGSFAAPWATAQKAVNEGKQILMLGEGNAGAIVATAHLDLTISGLGAGVSLISSIQSGGFNLVVRDGGYWSFEVTTNILSSAPGAHSGTVTLYRVYGPGASVIASGGAGAAVGQNGWDAGAIVMEYCYTSGVAANGGAGAMGDACTGGGNGGNGASVTLRHCRVPNVSGDPGVGGASGGTGGGSDGTGGVNGIINWCDLSNAPTGFQATEVHASLVGGIWTD